jgi:hypothetical protein
MELGHVVAAGEVAAAVMRDGVDAVARPADDVVSPTTEDLVSHAAAVAIQTRPPRAMRQRAAAWMLAESRASADPVVMAQHLSAGTAAESLTGETVSAIAVEIMIRRDGVVLKAAIALEIVAGLHVHAMVHHSLTALEPAHSRAAQLVAAAELSAEILGHVALMNGLSAHAGAAHISVKTADMAGIASADVSPVESADTAGADPSHVAAIKSADVTTPEAASTAGKSPHVAAAHMTAAEMTATHVAAPTKVAPAASVAAPAAMTAACIADARRLGEEESEPADTCRNDSKMRSHDCPSPECFKDLE